jgi:hypothetical protein
MKQSKAWPILSSLFLAGLLFSTALIAVAQSGRRVQKMPPPPPPPAGTTKESAPLPKPGPPKPATLITLHVGMERFDAFSRIPLANYSGVLQNFIDRLKRSPSLRVVDEGGNMGRGDAVRKAKDSKEERVVWLQMGLDRIGADRDTHVDIRDVFIEYVVYAPGTAKIIGQGRTYPQAHRSRTVIPTTRTGVIYGDYLYNQAAIEAAERVLSILDLSTRPLPRP